MLLISFDIEGKTTTPVQAYAIPRINEQVVQDKTIYKVFDVIWSFEAAANTTLVIVKLIQIGKLS